MGSTKKYCVKNCLLYGINGHSKISPQRFHQERVAGKIISIDILIYCKYPGNVPDHKQVSIDHLRICYTCTQLMTIKHIMRKTTCSSRQGTSQQWACIHKVQTFFALHAPWWCTAENWWVAADSNNLDVLYLALNDSRGIHISRSPPAIKRLCGWDIIGYCPYTFNGYELPGGKMYGNNGMFYENTKI